MKIDGIRSVEAIKKCMKDHVHVCDNQQYSNVTVNGVELLWVNWVVKFLFDKYYSAVWLGTVYEFIFKEYVVLW